MADRGSRQGGCGCNKNKSSGQAKAPAPKVMPAGAPAQTNPERPAR